jgi:hypothetical protein
VIKQTPLKTTTTSSPAWSEERGATSRRSYTQAPDIRGNYFEMEDTRFSDGNTAQTLE